ncbi:unnamed protein product [Protopolystoma xenopodis]|uniref:Uncharacterized protein n=1 Tax=Protopolystoma xenopodis TaxID=117903 RepID=A0A448WJW5_9PLAT|nr:unnamed protein product [Protopolystoma xenopodis]
MTLDASFGEPPTSTRSSAFAGTHATRFSVCFRLILVAMLGVSRCSPRNLLTSPRWREQFSGLLPFYVQIGFRQ